MRTDTPIFTEIDGQHFAHCATLSVLPDDSLLSAWFCGSYETAPDVTIFASRRTPEGQAWSAPQRIAYVEGHSLGQPVFLRQPDGSLTLFFNVITGKDWTSAQPYCQVSDDDGETWQPHQQLMDYEGLMFRSRPLVLENRLILPAYDEKTWQSVMLFSDDSGKTWNLSEFISTPQGNIHPCVVQLDTGQLLAYLRTGGKGGSIWRTVSTDGGETWETPTQTVFPNPNSGIDLLKLANGQLVLAYNDSDHLRTPLCVALGDQTENWAYRGVIEQDHAEFSYPTLGQTSDGCIHMVYTYKREHIHYTCFDETWLKDKQT